jgi:hypothetical protein
MYKHPKPNADALIVFNSQVLIARATGFNMLARVFGPFYMTHSEG